MAKCKECKYYSRTASGDEESFGGHSFIAHDSYDEECLIKNNKEITCKSFKQRTTL